MSLEPRLKNHPRVTGDPGRTLPAAPPMVRGYRPLILAAVVPESENVTSYWLAAPNGEALPTPVAGQFLPIAVEVPGHGVLMRSYTISAFEDGHYRLSVKRECRPGRPPGLVSNHIHDHWTAGDEIGAGQPAGNFVLNTTDQRPALLLAGGIGITPLLAMLRRLASHAPRRRVVLIWAVRNLHDHPFRREVAELRRRMSDLTVHVSYSRPHASWINTAQPDSIGHVDEALLRSLVPAPESEVYLCGPGPFMDAMRCKLGESGVPDERIRSETFGPAIDEHRQAQSQEDRPGATSLVTFVRSNRSAPFDLRALSLLEFAEDLGLNPAFNCRSGTCGACAVIKVSGAVHYEVVPTAAMAENEVLLCCALPDGPVALDC